MSDLLHDDDLRTERKPVKKPSKRWLNWWRARVTTAPCEACGSVLIAGEITPGCCGDGYPSKDIAETDAEEQQREDFEEFGFYPYDYLGAHPDGEAP